MTQAQLAPAARIGRVTLVRLERGERSSSYETLAAIARALGRTVREVVVGAEVPGGEVPSEGVAGSVSWCALR